MQYELRIQDPTNSGSSPLFDELVAIALAGKVVKLRLFFGFLTGNGVDALIGVREIRDVLLHSDVEVLVGLDAVTDRPGLERLLELAKKNPQFKPLVIKNTTGALIHPKMLVARYVDDRTVVVVGSNNLSLGGLSGNVEGYTIARFGPGEHLDLSDWNSFVLRWAPLIAEIDDEALKTAERNTRRLKRLRTAARGTSAKPDYGVVVSDGQVHESPASGVSDLEELLLVAQIPRAGNRWSQVHYSAEIIQDYFRIQAGDQVFLRQFNSSDVEQPQVVYSTVNRNYKIELGAAREAERVGGYPAEGRPVVLFRRESGALRRHRYTLVMPGDEGHAEMTALTEDAFKGPANHLPRVIVPRNRILAAWPECPL